MEKNLIINKRGDSNDEFKAILSYDSTKYGLGVKFAGFQIFLNNDTTPFVELIIDKKQKWGETIDFTKYLKPGTYRIRLRSFVWNDGSNNKTNCIFFLKVGSFQDLRVYPFPSIPTKGIDNSEILNYIENKNNNNFSPFEEFWDEWTVDYGV